MSHHESALKAQFYLTAPQPCPYLEGREERKVFTTLQGASAVAVNNALSARGFRRSQSVIYRPACVGCSACMSIRIPVAQFRPSKTQRRVIARNGDLTRRPCEAWATEAQFGLFRRYLDRRHADGGMADMDAFDYASMVDETPVNSAVIEYTRPDPETGEAQLIGACLSDILGDGLSMVYSFFEPDHPQRSLGAYMILDHVRLAAEMGLHYVYLGYWVAGSPKMSYKTQYRPFELCDGASWREYESVEAFEAWRRSRLETAAG
ncbi:arginyltransferase [Paralimibaculum aggregatum]|uniref:Aspartate/glutamate leucyltransferase n=1 Tax=Paralimibaculum aggregatum TaxID=3036245 RepID=A0ABQ6LDN0_9RHOB|nr:arginyltransferase [Limibaculum sp. NKW23]GMG81451.1 arginyltransferase [Limibaculum sp. NKW23]